MLDRIHTRPHSGFDALGSMRVSGNLDAVTMRLLDERAHLLLRVLLLTCRILEAHHSGRRTKFDHLRAMLDLIPHGFEDLINAIGDAALGVQFHHAWNKTRHIRVSACDSDG